MASERAAVVLCELLQVAATGSGVPTVILRGEMSCSSCLLCDSSCDEPNMYRFEQLAAVFFFVPSLRCISLPRQVRGYEIGHSIQAHSINS